MSMMYDENGQEWIVDYSEAYETWEDECEADDDGWDGWPIEPDESMDGDHDSAMESAGWGTDEDYGYYGEDF
jgi:hypothetical protein